MKFVDFKVDHFDTNQKGKGDHEKSYDISLETKYSIKTVDT